MQTVMVGDRRYHLPFVDLIPFDEGQDKQLGEAINEAAEVLVPVVCWKEKKGASEDTVIDGAHRVRWASYHGLKSVPKVYRSFDSEEEAKAECERINLDRRHLTEQQQTKARAARIERVAAMRRQGETIRAIAAAEGVSKTQVENDLKEAVVQGGGQLTPPDGKVTGKDGKKYKAAAPILCDRCKRVGARKNCQACDRARKEKAKKAAAKKQAEKEKLDPLKDVYGNEIPASLRGAWGDPWIQSTIDVLGVALGSILEHRTVEGLKKRAKHFPFFIEADIKDGLGTVQHYLDQLLDHFKAQRPWGLCPKCSGEKCSHCRNSGLVPKATYEELSRAS